MATSPQCQRVGVRLRLCMHGGRGSGRRRCVGMPPGGPTRTAWVHRGRSALEQVPRGRGIAAVDPVVAAIDVDDEEGWLVLPAWWVGCSQVMLTASTRMDSSRLASCSRLGCRLPGERGALVGEGDLVRRRQHRRPPGGRRAAAVMMTQL